MPIKGLTDRPRLPRLGKVHLGVRQPSGYPRPVDYFVVTESNSTPDWAAAAFRERYGDEPRELEPVVFPTDDPLQWADANLKMYTKSWGLVCRGDGESARAKWDPAQDGPRPEGVDGGTWANKQSQTWVYRELPCLDVECLMRQGDSPPCKPVMTLMFLLPEVRGIGAWQLETSSYNSIRNVQSSIELLRSATGGRIRGLPLKLRLVPMEVTPRNTKSKTVYVLDISLPDIKLGDLLREAQRLPETALMLPPAPDDEEPPPDLFPDAAEDEGQPEVSPPPPELAFASAGDFLNRCWQELGLRRDEVLERLDVQTLEQIDDLGAAYQFLKALSPGEQLRLAAP